MSARKFKVGDLVQTKPTGFNKTTYQVSALSDNGKVDLILYEPKSTQTNQHVYEGVSSRILVKIEPPAKRTWVFRLRRIMNSVKLGMHVNFVEHVWNQDTLKYTDRFSTGYVTESYLDGKNVEHYKVQEDSSRCAYKGQYHTVECDSEDILSIFKPPAVFFDE